MTDNFVRSCDLTQRQKLRALRPQQRPGGQLTAEQQARLQTRQQQAEANRHQQSKELLDVLTPEQRDQLQAKIRRTILRSRGGAGEQRDQLQAKMKNSRGHRKAPGALEISQP